MSDVPTHDHRDGASMGGPRSEPIGVPAEPPQAERLREIADAVLSGQDPGAGHAGSSAGALGGEPQPGQRMVASVPVVPLRESNSVTTSPVRWWSCSSG